MNPNNDRHISRLVEAHRWSRERLRPFRENATKFQREFAGARYSDSAAANTVPVNFLWQMITVLQRKLAPRHPRVMIGTPHLHLKPAATDMQIYCNHRLEEMDFRATLRELVIDALFSVGICKVGLAASDVAEYEGFLHDLGHPYADRVGLDYWVHEMAARRWDQCGFMGHLYQMPLEVAREHPMFVKEVRESLQATWNPAYNETGEERAATISRDVDVGGLSDLEDMVELWELWLPRDNLVLTFAADEGEGLSGRLLRIEDWYGPETGPYKFLSFTNVPDQIMPVSPTMQLYELHDGANNVFRKLLEQARRFKKIGAARNQEDADILIGLSDGEVGGVQDPGAIQEVTLGGIDQQLFLFFLQIKNLFDSMGGNISAIGGLGAQADTATQEELIHGSASGQVQDMQDQVLHFARSICRDLTWWWWTDPVKTYHVERRIHGTNITIPSALTPEEREADFLDLNFDIDIFSMAPDTPQSRMQSFMNILNGVVTPNLPYIQQQGGQAAWESILRKLAEYTNQPDLDQMIVFSGQPPRGPLDKPPTSPKQMLGNQQGSQARRSVSGIPQRNQDQVMMQLLGGGQGLAQAAGVAP